MTSKRRWTVNNVVVTEAQYGALNFVIRILSDDDSPQWNRDSATLIRLRDKLRPKV